MGMAEATSDGRLELWLARCRELAESPLDGIEEASKELAVLAQPDRHLMERVRRRLLVQQETSPEDRTVKQMLSLWRRALEVGRWTWRE